MLKKTDAFQLPPGLPVRRMAGLLLPVILLLSLMTACQEPPENNPSKYDPRNVTRIDDHQEGYPQIALDSNGHLHMVYQGRQEYHDPLNVYYMYQTDDQNWSTPEIISDSTGYDFMAPQIVADTQDNLHVVWEGEELKTYYTEKAAGGNWAKPQIIINTHNPLPQLGLDAQDNLFMVGMGENGGVFRERTGNSWLPEEKTPSSLTNAFLAVSPNGTVHVVFEDADHLIKYLRRTPSGSWQDIEQVSPSDTSLPYHGYPWTADVVQFNDTVYVSWVKIYSEQVLLRKRLPSGSWTDLDTLPQPPGYPWVSRLAVSPSGLSVAWGQHPVDGEYEIYYSFKPFGGNWQDPVLVSNTSTPSIGLSILMHQSQLYIVWQELLDNSIKGNIDIYYQKFELGGT